LFFAKYFSCPKTKPHPNQKGTKLVSFSKPSSEPITKKDTKKINIDIKK